MQFDNVVGTHQSSAPGEPPAPFTGDYRRSWKAGVAIDGLGTFGWVATDDPRAPWLEFGTIYMRPRPHIRPVVLASIEQLRMIMIRSVISAQELTAAELRSRGMLSSGLLP